MSYLQSSEHAIVRGIRLLPFAHRSGGPKRNHAHPQLLPLPAIRTRRVLHETASRLNQPNQRKSAEKGEDVKASKRKPTRSPAATGSLRRVAFEAERSRGRKSEATTTAGLLHIPNGQETKTVTAYCAAEQYSIEQVAQLLRDAGYTLDPFQTDLYPQVIHFQMPSVALNITGLESKHRPTALLGDVFVFPLGTIVAWDVSEESIKQLLAGVLTKAAVNPHPTRLETEDLDYFEDKTSEKSSVTGDTIRIGTKPPPSVTMQNDLDSVTGADNAPDAAASQKPSNSADVKKSLSLAGLGYTSFEEQRAHQQNLTLAKIAFSSGLARSTKIAVLESLLDSYFANTQHIPSLLSTGSRLPYNRAFMLRKTGELLSVRAQLNLTELTDRLPDLFWDSRHELGLEGYFDQVGRALDVGVRIKTLNERMDYAQEIATVLRENLSERHGLLLEWLIIGLIAVEVGVEGWKISREARASRDPNSTENMMHRWLERELERAQ